MNSSRLIAFAAATCGLLFSVGASAAPAAQTSPLQIHQTTDARFPPNLVPLAITRGEAWIMITVDREGRLSDAMAIRYTHRAFAHEALTALKKWRYEPARLNGEPIAVRTEVQFSFHAEGVVISLDSMLSLEQLASFDERPSYVTELCLPRELDRLPTPVRSVSPGHPGRAANAPIPGGRAVIEFIIDQKGQPRMPVLVSSPHPQFSNEAAAALAQWLFTPPTREGRPVAVKVRQEFVFPSDS
ncbi:MAG TPA: TonB family protein [Opitutus sp.]|nr:TonB family protein [Opitutus sp.]